MKFGKRRQAMHAMLMLAELPGDQRLSGRQLAERLNLPPRYLEAVLQQLVHAGLLMAHRGPTGGYVLGRERRNISLKDIWIAVTTDDVDDDSGRHAGLDAALQSAEAAFLHHLESRTLDRLAIPITITSDFTI